MATMARELAWPGEYSLQAFQLLRFAFTVAPILAGLDKFVHLLANWEMYVAPQIASILPFSAQTFMKIAGGVEILAGLLVAFRPAIGGWIVAAWLWCIILNLLIMGAFYDIALRDFGLSLAALALARLALIRPPRS